MQNLFWIIQTCYINKQHHQGMMCVWIKGHLSAKSVKIVAIFYLYRGKIQILSSLLSKCKIICIAILLGVCLSCLESNDLPSFPLSNIHNRHVKYVTVYNQLKCNTTKNNYYILKKYFFLLNALYEYVI